MKTSRRNFERIPVPVVKRIAELFPVEREMADDAVRIESPAEQTVPPLPAGDALENGIDSLSTHHDWRDIARQVQVETDSNKLIQLVQELIEKFQQEKLQKNGTDDPLRDRELSR
jgi:hypothetical protein